MTRPPGTRIAAAAALVVLLAPAVRSHAARLDPATATSGVRWTLAPAAPADSLSALATWRARLGDPATAPTALRVLARARLAAGDAAGADSCWRVLSRLRGPWQADAALGLADLDLARAGAAAAESSLGAVRLLDATPAEEARLFERLSALRAAAGDAAGAEAAARAVVRGYPAVPVVAARALARLDSLRGARADSLAFADLRAGAEVEWFRGNRPAAIERLRRARERAEGDTRFEVAVRLAQVLRDSRMPRTSGVAAGVALAAAVTPAQRATAELEQARSLRAAGASDSALARFARVGRGTADAATRATAWWEYAREAEDEGRYRIALEGFRRCAQLGGRRADDSRMLAGLMHFTLGARDSAIADWRQARGEAARFWLAVALRPDDRAASDSLLRTLARTPGFSFHRAAARDTLDAARDSDATDPAWHEAERGTVVMLPGSEPPAVAEARLLFATGRPDDAAALLGAVQARDARVLPATSRTPESLLAAAAAAYDGGAIALGTRLAEGALAAAGDDSVAWAVAPWAFPPAFAREVRAASDTLLPADLLWAMVRQESRFDPRARSRSDALGLTQLLKAAANDMADRLRERRPDAEALFDPARSIRLGAEYLRLMLARFGGSPAIALAAYNAGPSNVRPDWRAILDRGGEALASELASNADSQDYARRIAGFRRAYRALAPEDTRP